VSGPKARGRGSRPSKTSETLAESKPSEAHGYPRLSLRHLQSGYGVEELSQSQQAAFLIKWAKRSRFTWTELSTHHRHGLGSEQLPASSIKRVPPEQLAQDKYMVLRHEGNQPFVGYKIGDTFYVLWIEANYGDVYDH
jgi:hypothetical protein